MDASFWKARWENNQIGFHESDANPHLVNYFSELSVPQNSRVFLPLCGKTRDISWLLSQGYRVAGAELSEIAITQLFDELGVAPTITDLGKTHLYSAENIEIFVGNIFDLPRRTLGRVDAVYDRAALVALPAEMRAQYTAHLMDMTDAAPQLMICYEYDQTIMAGPPFSVKDEEVRRHYGNRYDLTIALSANLPGGLKGKCPAQENVWLLRRK